MAINSDIETLMMSHEWKRAGRILRDWEGTVETGEQVEEGVGWPQQVEKIISKTLFEAPKPSTLLHLFSTNMANWDLFELVLFLPTYFQPPSKSSAIVSAESSWQLYIMNKPTIINCHFSLSYMRTCIPEFPSRDKHCSSDAGPTSHKRWERNSN